MKKTPNSKSRQRYRLELEFAGTGFSGWQKQTNARSIQGTLLDAAEEIFSDPKADVQGHGRTDAGVHALTYTAHLETRVSDIEPANICIRFNQLLPSSVVMLSVEPCDLRFHARLNCVGRSYLYQVLKRKSALNRNFAWWPKYQLNVEAMQEAAKLFVGMHDFAAFAEKPELKKSTQVLINGVFIEEDADMIRIRVVGSHFLWKMVRRIAGVLVEVGRGKLKLRDVSAFIDGSACRAAQYTAPASGLFFERAFYDQELFEKFLSENY